MLMAEAPVKSQQPLHNFPLSHLKWARKNSYRRRHSPAPPPEEENKPWNLRSSSKKETMVTAEKSNDFDDMGVVVVKPKCQKSRGFVEGVEKNKRRMWISLSKEEIEEDVYAITGAKPSRRPKKWPKNVQKQLDCLFPGLYLVGVTAEMYHDDHHTAKVTGDCVIWLSSYGAFCF